MPSPIALIVRQGNTWRQQATPPSPIALIAQPANTWRRKATMPSLIALIVRQGNTWRRQATPPSLLALIAQPANTWRRKATTLSLIALIAQPANTWRKRVRQIAWNVPGFLGLCTQVQLPAQIAVLATILMLWEEQLCVLRVTQAHSLRQTEPLHFRPASPAGLGHIATPQGPLSAPIVLREHIRGVSGQRHPTSAYPAQAASIRARDRPRA